MRISFDPVKRARTLADRGLDVGDAAVVFEGTKVEFEDTCSEYGEPRIICFGLLSGRLVVIGRTPRGRTRHIFSMRKANDREKARLAPSFEVRPRQGRRSLDPRARVQGVAATRRAGVGSCHRKQGRAAPFGEPARTHFHPAACRRHRTLEGDGTWLANPHGRTSEQSSVVPVQLDEAIERARRCASSTWRARAPHAARLSL